MNILECKQLTKKFPGKVALNAVNLEIPAGKIVGLLGPNGSGKTTLIKIIAGLITKNSGEVYIDGKEPGVETKAIVSYLPERLYFSPSMTVNECLDYFEDFYSDFDRARAEKMLDVLQIEKKNRLKKLSKGTKEKVQLVLVMSRNAKLYLLDEPIGGVDPATRDYILNTIIQNYQSDSSVIISTHLISDVESILDEFIFIKDGNIICHETADQVRQEEQKSLDEYFREVFKCY